MRLFFLVEDQHKAWIDWEYMSLSQLLGQRKFLQFRAFCSVMSTWWTDEPALLLSTANAHRNINSEQYQFAVATDPTSIFSQPTPVIFKHLCLHALGRFYSLVGNPGLKLPASLGWVHLMTLKAIQLTWILAECTLVKGTSSKQPGEVRVFIWCSC